MGLAFVYISFFILSWFNEQFLVINRIRMHATGKKNDSLGETGENTGILSAFMGL